MYEKDKMKNKKCVTAYRDEKKRNSIDHVVRIISLALFSFHVVDVL